MSNPPTYKNRPPLSHKRANTSAFSAVSAALAGISENLRDNYSLTFACTCARACVHSQSATDNCPIKRVICGGESRYRPQTPLCHGANGTGGAFFISGGGGDD